MPASNKNQGGSSFAMNDNEWTSLTTFAKTVQVSQADEASWGKFCSTLQIGHGFNMCPPTPIKLPDGLTTNDLQVASNVLSNAPAGNPAVTSLLTTINQLVAMSA